MESSPTKPARKSRVILVILFFVVAAVCARLGVWQVHRLEQRRAANARALAERALPEANLAQHAPDTALSGRRVRARGTYDRAHEFVVRGEVIETPGVEIVTPLRLAGSDTAVLVDRGFVPSPDALTLSDSTRAAIDEPGVRDVIGLASPMHAAPDSGWPVVTAGRTTWRRIDLGAVRARLPYPVLDVVILQEPNAALPSFPRRRPPPALDDGPHLDYAIQWFSFAVIALVFAAVVWRRGTGAPREI